MATPKTDVTQSIGRILRTKHSQPIVGMRDHTMYLNVNVTKELNIITNKVIKFNVVLLKTTMNL